MIGRSKQSYHVLRAGHTLRLTSATQTRGTPCACQAHRFEELGDVDLVVQALAPTRFEDKVARERLSRCRLERSELDRLVERVARAIGKVVKRLHAKGLTEGMCCERERGKQKKKKSAQKVKGSGESICWLTPQIGLKPVGVNDGDVGLNGEQRRAGLGNVLGDVSSSTSQDLVNGRNAVLRRLDLDKVDRLQGEKSEHASQCLHTQGAAVSEARRTSCSRGVAIKNEE